MIEMVMFDCVESILLRLPVEDLLRCKSVHKSWYSLISSPSFVKTHVKFVCKKEENNKRKIAKITSYLEVANSKSGYEVPPEWKLYDYWEMQGSSNGLVLYSGPRISLTNPVTREFRELQLLQPLVSTQSRCFGFGYDSSTDDYKVVRAICLQGKTVVHVLPLKSNSWKLFGQINYMFDDMWLQQPGILFNGVLHWFWYDLNNMPLIVSFDLAKEEFKEIPQPDDTRYVWNIGCTLGTMDGRLCIFPYFDDAEELPSCGIWLIKNYNTKPSWELLSKDNEMNDDHAIHYILNNDDASRCKIMAAYACDENIHLSRSKEYIPSPIFVQTLVSPFVNNDNNAGPSHTKDNKSTANA